MSARESEEVRVVVAEKCSLGRMPGTEVVTLKLSWETQDRDSLALLENAPSHLKYHHHDSHVAFHTLS